MKVLSLKQIKLALSSVDLMAEIEAGFVAYSEGRAVVPPVGELVLNNPPGDVHIKYGYIRGDDYYVVKVASGFYENAKLGLPSSNGMMLAFSQETGQPVAVLLDEGHLTDVRTALAGAIAAKYLAPREVRRIGIVGTGMQARLQLEYLKPVTACREVLVWGRGASQLAAYQSAMQEQGFAVALTKDADEVLQTCNLIVTTTPSEAAILRHANKLQSGTHITAMGSDTEHKRELSAEIMQAADLLVADSIPQCLERGEIHQALKDKTIRKEDIVELGNIISGAVPGRSNDKQITIADLTGVAVQDIQITKAVLDAAEQKQT